MGIPTFPGIIFRRFDILNKLKILAPGQTFPCILIFYILVPGHIETAMAEVSSRQDTMTLFMAGDVMTGRGIDQVLARPGDPVLYEPYVKDARKYVELAEIINGPIRSPVDCQYIWGDALVEWERVRPAVRLVNLETSITTSNQNWPDKGIHYRMHPGNTRCLTAAGIDICSLANNHVLDWGYPGLIDTLDTLKSMDIKYTGAGRNRQEAGTPVIFDVINGGRIIVFSYGLGSSGIPAIWAAREDRAGVNYLSDLSEATIRQIMDAVSTVKQQGDIVVASIHWGGNWGYDVRGSHIDFAHRLIDETGIDVIHGHSSHHPKPLEIYNGKLIIYGSGDCINDYEGIGGYEEYRDDLVLMYFANIDRFNGKLVQLQMIPMQIKNFSLNRASRKDAMWLQKTLNREGKKYGTQLHLNEGNILVVPAD